MASVSFYEEMGFTRVGAVARYASEGMPIAALPLQVNICMFMYMYIDMDIEIYRSIYLYIYLYASKCM